MSLARSRPSISNASGEARRLRVSRTASATPSRPRTTPQHSFGASRRACSMISSRRWRAILIARPDYEALRAQRVGVLVVGVALGIARDRVLELAHAVAERAAEVRQLLRAQHDQGDDEDDDQFGEADVEGHERSFGAGGVLDECGLPPH